MTHPLPVVTHPLRNVLQAVFVALSEGASVHVKALHDPGTELSVQGPSIPIIPLQVV